MFKEQADATAGGMSRMGRSARGRSEAPAPDFFPEGATSDGWARESAPAGMPRIVVRSLLSGLGLTGMSPADLSRHRVCMGCARGASA